MFLSRSRGENTIFYYIFIFTEIFPSGKHTGPLVLLACLVYTAHIIVYYIILCTYYTERTAAKTGLEVLLWDEEIKQYKSRSRVENVSNRCFAYCSPAAVPVRPPLSASSLTRLPRACTLRTFAIL